MDRELPSPLIAEPIRHCRLLDLTLTSLDPGPRAANNGVSVLTFELTNQGNGAEAFRLSRHGNCGQ